MNEADHQRLLSDENIRKRNPHLTGKAIITNRNPSGKKPFEIIIGDIFKELHKKYGENIPEIELLGSHVDNVSSIYNACHCHISTTGAEGYGMIFPESAACGLINIAPRYSGQLDFLNDDNSLLIDTKLRYARPNEQYWAYNKNSKIGQPDQNHTAELMIRAYKEYDQLKEKFDPNMKKMVLELDWKNAAQKMIDAVNGNIEPYEVGTYKGLF